MNISLLINNDLPSCLALNYLLPALSEHRLSLFRSSRVGRPASPDSGLAKLRFFEQTLFTELLFPALDRHTGETEAELQTFTGLARRSGRPLHILNGINDGEDFAIFAASEPDLVICIRYGVILRQPVINLPRLGVLNLHSGLLPGYRGVMASFWALLAGETELGTTLHTIDDAGIDTGRLISCSILPVDENRSYLWHVCELYQAGCRNLAAAVNNLARGEALDAIPQPAAGNYYSFPDQEALEAFENKGLQLVSGEEIAALARRFIC